jgi:hypothetical protein
MARIAQDARFAIRLIIRQPARSAVLVGVLALGIAANTALFAIVNTVALRPLPYPDADRVVRVWDRHAEGGLMFFSVSVPHLFEWQKRRDVFSAVGAYREDGFALATPGGTVAVDGAWATAGLFDVLGVRRR